MHLWQFIIPPTKMSPVDSQNKPESCRKKKGKNEPGLYEPDASSFLLGLTTAPLNMLTLLPVTKGAAPLELE